MKVRYSSDSDDELSRRNSCPETPAVSNAAGSESVRNSDNTSTRYIEKSVGRKIKGSKYVAGGLRHFSSIVCNKLKSKGVTTYKEVANDLVADIPGLYGETEAMSECDAKNIQRRVYDVLNVLLAMDIITMQKKQIRWKGFEDTDAIDWEGIKAQHVKLMDRIHAKEAYLKDLEEQMADLQNLLSRNRQLLKSGNCSRNRFSLPFILAQTSNTATVEVEISENMQMVHCDFNRLKKWVSKFLNLLVFELWYGFVRNLEIGNSNSKLMSGLILIDMYRQAIYGRHTTAY